MIPGDGDVVEGLATVDESAITGESAPVIRESGGDRCAVTGGTTVLSDRIVVRITTQPGETFIDRMIALVEGAARQKTPNEIALNILLATLTIIFLLVVMALQPMAAYSGGLQQVVVLPRLRARRQRLADRSRHQPPHSIVATDAARCRRAGRRGFGRTSTSTSSATPVPPGGGLTMVVDLPMVPATLTPTAAGSAP